MGDQENVVDEKSRGDTSGYWGTWSCHQEFRTVHRKVRNTNKDRTPTEDRVTGNSKDFEKDIRELNNKGERS